MPVRARQAYLITSLCALFLRFFTLLTTVLRSLNIEYGYIHLKLAGRTERSQPKDNTIDLLLMLARRRQAEVSRQQKEKENQKDEVKTCVQ